MISLFPSLTFPRHGRWKDTYPVTFTQSTKSHEKSLITIANLEISILVLTRWGGLAIVVASQETWLGVVAPLWRLTFEHQRASSVTDPHFIL